MARHRDPTARLRSLTVDRPTAHDAAAVTAVTAVTAAAAAAATAAPQPAGRHAMPSPHVALSTVVGWVPDWVRAEPPPDPRPPPPDPGPPPAAGWMTTEAADDPADETAAADAEDAADPAPTMPDIDEPVRLPSRWHRLRERWVPEQLHGVRVDPGRRGLLLLSLISAVAALVAALGVWLGAPGRAALQPVSSGTTVVVSAPSASTAVSAVSAGSAPTTDPAAELVVSVTGAVHQPGLVTLPAGARVADAVAAAGGPLDGADLTGMNLAARLSDGDSIVVGGPGSTVQGAGGSGSGSAAGGGALIDLNTADEATLETLPGVGPVMAGNIVSWRTTNGPFTAVDQLQDVTGIGPTRFATLAPLVTV